jgi:alpha-N-arabinofuranosidase
MVNVLQAMILTDGPRMTLTPTYHAFAMYQPFQGGARLPLTIRSARFGAGDAALSMVDGTAARGIDGKVYVALTNLDPDRPVQVSLTLGGGTAGRVTGRILSAPTMDAHNTFDAPDRVRPVDFRDARISGGVLTTRLPAKSLVVLTLEVRD